MEKYAVLILIVFLLLSGCIDKKDAVESNSTENLTDIAEKTSMNIRDNNFFSSSADNVSNVRLHYKVMPNTQIKSVILPDGTIIEGKWLRNRNDKIKIFNFKVFDFAIVNSSIKNNMQNIYIEWVKPIIGKNILANITITGSNNFSTHIEVDGMNEKGKNIELFAEGIRYEYEK